MVSIKQKVLIGLLIVDSFLLIEAAISPSKSALSGWIALNVIVFLITGFVLLIRRRRRSADSYTIGKEQQEYGIRCKTLNGEEVKSKEERIIADYLRQNNVRYEYEKKVGYFYPDFYLIDYHVIVEYWGMVDVDDNADRTRYRNTKNHKKAFYFRSRIKCIDLYPSNLPNLDWIFRAKFRSATGIELP